MADPNILSKIKKCLRLAESGNPHEAATALLRAQEMMAKYGVEAAQLRETETSQFTVERGSVRSIATATKTKDWECYLLTKLGSVFGCDVLFKAGLSRETIKHLGLPSQEQFAIYTFIGLGHDVEVCRYTAEVLLRSLKKQRTKFTKSAIGSRATKTRKTDSYCWGWVKGCLTQVRSMKEVREDQAAGSSTALKIMSFEEKRLAAIRDYINHHATGTGPQMNNSSYRDFTSYRQGVEDGSKVQVNRAVQGGKK